MSLLGINSTIRYYKLRGNSVVHATPLTCLEHLQPIVRDKSQLASWILYLYTFVPTILELPSRQKADFFGSKSNLGKEA